MFADAFPGAGAFYGEDQKCQVAPSRGFSHEHAASGCILDSVTVFADCRTALSIALRLSGGD